MDYQEAIETLKRNKPTSDPRRCGKELCEACDVAISAMQELQEYKQLGTLEEVREAVEKQTAKEPRTTNRCYVCPHCGFVNSLRAKRNYCDACGQKILWKVEEWGKKSYQ